MARPARTRVTFQLRWLLLTVSGVVVLLLRQRRGLLAAYVAMVLLCLALYIWVGPRVVSRAERRFQRDALRLVARGEAGALPRLVARQWLLRRSGRRYVLSDVQGLAASQAGEHEEARAHFQEALAGAPPEERSRVELNLATEEAITGHLDAAEARLRSALARRAEHPVALAALGRLLLRRERDLAAAADLLGRASGVCDPRDLPALALGRAEALIRGGLPGGPEALAQARDAGVSREDLERLAALSPHDGPPSGRDA